MSKVSSTIEADSGVHTARAQSRSVSVQVEQTTLVAEPTTPVGEQTTPPASDDGMSGFSGKFPLPRISQQSKTKLKLIISLALFGSIFAFGKIDLSESIQAAVSANKGYLGTACVLFLASIFVMAHRWQLLANAVGLKKPFLKMVQLCYVGLFFNLFLPSTVGGDVSRCYYLTKGTNKYLHALTSVLVDRAMGLAVLLLFATLGLLFGPGGQDLSLQMKLPIFALTFGMYFVIPFMPQLSSRILGENNWITRKLNHSSAKVYWQDRGLTLMTLFLSVVSQILMVACHIAVGLALGLNDIPLWYYFVFYPSVAVLGFVTPSVNGIGVREWAYTYFLAIMGVDNSLALTYALIWLGLTTMGSVVGGIVYVLGRFRPIEKDVQTAA